MSEPFFSIIIPTLNEERYLPRLLEALAKQNYRSFEVIIVDGFSFDNTVKKANEIGNKLPKLSVFSLKQRNVSYQRNYGANKAKGKYLIFFDADVLISSDFLDLLQRQIKLDNPSLATTWLKADSDQVQDGVLVSLSNLALETARLIGRPLLPGFNVVVKRDVFHQMEGFDSSLKLAEDHDFAQRAATYGHHLTIYKRPTLTASLRRFRHVGTVNVIILYTIAALHVLLKGPIRQELFDYPMGGHLYQKEPTRRLFSHPLIHSFDRLISSTMPGFSPSHLKFKIKSSGRRIITDYLPPQLIEKLRSQIKRIYEE